MALPLPMFDTRIIHDIIVQKIGYFRVRSLHGDQENYEILIGKSEPNKQFKVRSASIKGQTNILDMSKLCML